MTKLSNEIRFRLDKENMIAFDQIKKENPSIVSNKAVVLFLIHYYLDNQNKLKERLNKLAINQQINQELLGELMYSANGFKDKNGLPIVEVKTGAEFAGVTSARQKVLNRIKEAREEKSKTRSEY